MIRIKKAQPDDTAVIVAMNADVVDVTSPMDDARFRHLLEISSHCVVAEADGKVAGFVIAMTNGAPYENPNFDWFSQRLNHFVYIDRIVISAAGRGHGLGGLLYKHVAEAAKEAGSLVMAAEMNLVPPNHGSLNFHSKRGFVKLGTRALDNDKVLSMQIVNL